MILTIALGTARTPIFINVVFAFLLTFEVVNPPVYVIWCGSPSHRLLGATANLGSEVKLTLTLTLNRIIV